MTSAEKYRHALRLRKAMTDRKKSSAIIAEETETLVSYINETGDRDFCWKSGLTLTFVSGHEPEQKVDASLFLKEAEKRLPPETFAAIAAKATRPMGGRKASFR